MPSSDDLANMSELLSGSIALVMEASIIIDELTDENQLVLQETLNKLTEKLDTIDTNANALKSIKIPNDIIEQIDNGEDPSIHTNNELKSLKSRHETIQSTMEKLKIMQGYIQDRIDSSL